ncbi:WD repeat-containing protein 35, partial [Blattella germanica]
IAIPNNTKLNCLAWNREQGYLACGGDEGLLKVLKLQPGSDSKVKGLAAPSNLSMNQTLEGHSGQIQVITWNEIHQKLTTSDQYGLIIVWMLYKGSWYEEMINNRNKSVVKGMAWNSDGQKICIVYEDGAVIVGSVDGNRIWGKELKGSTLSGVEWSPDGKMLLFSLRSGEIHVYDNQGSFTCLPNVMAPTQVVGMHWYDGKQGYVEQDCPVLAICYQNGCMQIMRGENDDSKYCNTIILIFNYLLYAMFSCVFQCYNKSVKSLLAIAACGEHCVLATRAEEAGNSGQYGLILCNAISTPVDTKYMDVEPLWVSMNSSHVFAASRNNFLLWHYRTPKSRSTLNLSGARQRKERLYHIDDTPSGVAEVIQDLDRSYEPATNMQPTADAICCMTASEKTLIIGRESGSLQRYSLPQVALTNRYTLNCRPYKLAINCNTTRLAVIDVTGIMTFLDLESPSLSSNFSGSGDALDISLMGNNNSKELSKFERKDVWAMKWASDNPELIAIMEKTRMYDLEIRAVLLDEIMQNPDHPVAEHLLDLEVKSLRDTRDLLDKVGISEATTFIEENPHPRLWRLLAEAAVKQLDLPTAEAAFVRCSDYPGIQFVKRLHNIHNDTLKKAEVAAYFKDFNEAEKLYLEVDRRDLAISLREKLGDWFRVVQLMKMGSGGSDIQMEVAWNSIGDYFVDRQNWEGAREYYEKGRNQEQLVKCYYMLEDYTSLENIANNLSENHALLPTIGEMFASVGMCAQAVSSYIKCGQVKLAVDTCVNLNQWDQAVDLAKRYKLPEIGNLLAKYATHLLAKDRLLEAVELYRKANHFLEAAKLLYQLSEAEAKKKSQPLRVKKLYVLSALLVEEHQRYLKQQAHGSAGGRTRALMMGLLETETELDVNTKIVDNAWKGAEAYHFFMLAQQQLYEAMKTALHLREYEDILESEDIYCILALASCANRAFGTCSKAFIKLESLNKIPENKRKEYEALAMDIFTKYTPKDARICPSCGNRFPICVASGRPLMDVTTAWTCTVCKHSAAEQDMNVRQSCPLCHSPVHS